MNNNTLTFQQRLNFFRATFAGTDETITKGVIIFCDTVLEFFSVGQGDFV